MIEPPQLFTHERLIFDIKEIESLASLILELQIPIDRVLCDSFERLVELAGTRDFVLAFAKLQDYMHQIKSRQRRALENVPIVPLSCLQELNDWVHSDKLLSSPGVTLAGGLIGSGFESRPTIPTLSSQDFERLGIKKNRPLIHPSQPTSFLDSFLMSGNNTSMTSATTTMDFMACLPPPTNLEISDILKFDFLHASAPEILDKELDSLIAELNMPLRPSSDLSLI
jgi:hypothetical protein